jgi:hypothetical protein
MQLRTGEWRLHYTTMYFVSLALLVASLPLSKFTMSVFEFSTLFFWLWHGVDTEFLKKYPSRSLLNPLNLLRFLGEVLSEVFTALVHKFAEFFRNKPAMAIASIMLLHVIGLIYTTDFEYALKDLRTKLPIFILPLFIATGPRISTKIFYRILALFIAAVVSGSIYRLILFLNMPVADSRAVEAHTSHIRYSLNAVYAVFILFFFVFSKGNLKAWLKLLLIFTAIWLVAFMAYMNFTTGVIIFLFVSFLLLLFYTFKIKNILLKTAALISISLMIILPLYYILSIGYRYINTPQVEFSKLDKYTHNGNSYYHDTLNFKSKNGKWTGLYICDKELREAWAQRSKLPIDSLDKMKQTTRLTLITYLASKDLRKDTDGVSRLSDADIINIENGINRYDYNKLPGLRTQIEDFVTSYQRYKNQHDPNSSSLIQRFEYWRTSLLVIRQHPLFGVGTGDLPMVFENQYREMKSDLATQYRLRSHNQYLSITVGFGLIGLAWFMFVMFYPGIKTRNFNNYFYVIFWIIFMVSMLTEDTIENQEGVTFYALFTALMILGRDKTEPSESLSD